MSIQLSWTLVAALLAVSAAPAGAPPAGPAGECPFEITSNKPFVRVAINGSAPQWFILDTGCSGGSVIAKECADRLGLEQGGEVRRHVGAGAGVSVGIATTPDVTLEVGGDTLGAPALRVFSLAHVAPFEGRRLDGLLGEDFLRRHVVEIDYQTRRLRIIDPAGYAPRPSATLVPIELDTGLAVASGAITPAGGTSIPCRFVIDTGVRTTVVMFHPFAARHGFLDPGRRMLTATIGGGAGGETRGDIGRLDSLRIGNFSFARPTAIFSRDTVGVFAGGDPDGIVGGELLRRCRVTFDYPHERLVLEPYPGPKAAFEYDMSGTFLVGEGPDYSRIRIFSVAEKTPAADAGLRRDDEIVSIDGRPAADLGLEGARELFRKPARYRLEITRGGTRIKVELATRRLV